MTLLERKNVDAFVAVVHILAILILYNVDQSFVERIVGRLLLAMEITTIVFHLFYWVSFRYGFDVIPGPEPERWNGWKWLEYAVSCPRGGGGRSGAC